MNKKKSQIQYTENPLGSIATINSANGAVSEEKIRKIEHKRIDEGGLSRLYNHIKDNGTFAVIGSQDKDTGEDRSQELYNIAMLGKFKFNGFNWVLGTYTYDDPDKPVARENSMIFYNISKEDALRIGKQLNQETILWKDPEFFGYIYVDSGEVPEWNKGGFSGDMSFNPETIKDIGGSSSLVGKGWSVNPNKLKSKNKPFVYECFLVEPALKTGYVSEYLIDSYNGVDNSTNNSYNSKRGDSMSRIKENVNPYLREEVELVERDKSEPTQRKNEIKPRVRTTDTEDDFDRRWEEKFGHTVGKEMSIEEFHKLMKEMRDFR